jgi:Acyclic terpene utilisation family protein AtuA
MTNQQEIRSGVKVLVPSGMLGAGIRAEHVRYGIERGAHAIALDAGSTDSGPSYLARAVSKMNRHAIQRDMEVLMLAASQANIPILVGTCGTCGADDAVNWTRDIVVEVAQALGLRPKIACLYSEQDRRVLKEKNRQGKISPLEPLGPLSDATLDACEHIVALMGPEPYIHALRAGADIVLGGRTTDTAVLAAVPLMRGAGAAPSWHASKVSECGGQCTVHPRLGGVLMTVGRDEFDIEPLSPSNQCTPRSASAHMLYETSDPFQLTEPGGILDVGAALYRPLNERVTRVSGSRWRPMPYTMKLEGASAGPYQTIMLIGIEDPLVLSDLDEFETRMKAALIERIKSTFGADTPSFEVSLRIYGWNAVSGRPRPREAAPPVEVGVLFVVTAPTQALADQMAKACNPYFFHFPVRSDIELPSYAFPFTPAEIPRGQVYEFLLNHVVHAADGLELTRTAWVDLSSGS